MPRFLISGNYVESSTKFYEYNVVAIGINDNNLVVILDDHEILSKDLYDFLSKKCEIKSLSEIENQNLSLEIKTVSRDVKQTASCLQDALCEIIGAICEIYKDE